MEKELVVFRWMEGAHHIDDRHVKIKNEISGYKGTITKLSQDFREELAKLEYDSNVSISRKEVSACYIVVR